MTKKTIRKTTWGQKTHTWKTRGLMENTGSTGKHKAWKQGVLVGNTGSGGKHRGVENTGSGGKHGA